ncbi:hypothetical protein FRC12_010861 [Ceratobasidium sp. 428]|nr:hypothetical protein FRC12_010861 [Ceratobasidium sp. 428]
MPNALTMFLLWNTVFMSFMQPYIWLNYVSYHSPSLRTTSSMYFWYGFIYIWDGVGMWLSAFGTLYAILLPRLLVLDPSEHRIASTLLHPITLNVFCLAPPITLIITQITTSIFSVIAWSNIVHTQFSLIDMLVELATQWATYDRHGVNEALRRQAIELGTRFLEQKSISKAAFQRNAGTCAAWYWLCVVLFTPTAIWLLWIISTSLKHHTKRVEPNLPCTASNPVPALPSSSHLQPNRTPHSSTIVPVPPPSFGRLGDISRSTHSEMGGASPQSETAKQLRWAFLTVGLQFSAIFFCMGAAAGGWLWTSVDAGRMIARLVTSPIHSSCMAY